jgi:hypothetical protein
MSIIRVAGVGEIPPGKGKQMEIADREVTVYNVDGRFYATATRHARVAHGHLEITHVSAGGIFEVYAEDSPARVRADQERIVVRIEADAIYVELGD